MFEFFSKLFDTSDFPARWHCGQWTEAHGWLHIIADVAVFGAYLAIPCVLIYFMLKRDDVPFPGILWLFGAFIFACGLGHLIEATLFWRPWYRFAGVVKVATAVVSWITVLALIPAVPKALALPGLAVDKRRLEHEVEQRRSTEDDLRERTALLEQHSADLETFTNSVVDREERMIELKQEVDELLGELGREPRYTVAEA